MSKAEYCDDCGRIVGIGCACGMTFAEKIRSTGLHYAEWSPTEAGKPKGDGIHIG